MPGNSETTDADTASAIILLSHAGIDWQKLINGILDTGIPPASTDYAAEGALDSAQVYRRQWLVDNKYYTAVVQLTVMAQHWHQHINAMRAEGEALIVYWDNTTKAPLQDLDSMVDQLRGFQPEVCLLVCDCFSAQANTTRHNSIEWCVRHGWELVELKEEEMEVEEEQLEDDFPESKSFHRIKGALNANCWSNLKRKTTKASGQPSTEEKDGSSQPLITNRDRLFGGDVTEPLDSLRTDDDDDGEYVNAGSNGDEFEDIFTQFESLRLTASTLPPTDRLDYAERVAMAFLDALGDDEDDPIAVPVVGLEMELPHLEDDGDVSALAGDGDDDDDENYGDVKWERLEEYEPCLEELGFPVLGDSPSTISWSNSESDGGAPATCDAVVTDSQETDVMNIAAGETSGALHVNEFLAVRTYDEIEQEINDIETQKKMKTLKETANIRKEIEEFDDSEKKHKCG